MKKIFAFAAAIVLFAGIANAQLGINVGYAPQTYTTTVGSNDPTTMEMTGFFAGVNYNQPIASGINVSVGLQGRYNTLTETETVSLGILGNANATAKHTQMLLDVPVLFNYGINLNGGLKLTLFAGPTFSLALNGKTAWTADANVLGLLNLGNDGVDDWYETSDNRSKTDVSGTFGLCASFNSLRLFGGYNMGLLNLSTADNTTLKASNWFVGVGYAL